MNELKVYTLEEAAQILHITRRTIYNYITAGKFPAVKVGGRWLITEDNLKDFLTKKEPKS